LPRADDPLSRKLPDGSVFTVMQVELGSRADFSFPERPGKKGGRTSGSISIVSIDAAETLFIGTTQVGGNGQCDVGRLQVESDDGSVFDGVFTSGTLGTSEGVLRAWRVYAFPRRGRELTLRFSQSCAGAIRDLGAKRLARGADQRRHRGKPRGV
jgi:hypothetical protein